MDFECYFTAATETDLNEMLAGHEVGGAVDWKTAASQKLPADSVGVVWSKHAGNRVRPLLLVVPDGHLRRLYGRFAQLRSDLSPISPWCHVLTPDRFETLDSLTRAPDLFGLEAAWTGLAIAEAKLLADRPITNIRISACLATQTFAIARASALWHRVSVDSVLSKFDAALSLLRTGSKNRQDFSGSRLRAPLMPIWNSLMALNGLRGSPELQPVLAALRALLDARNRGDDNESARFADCFLDAVPESADLLHLRDMTAERRLELFDKFMRLVENTSSRHEPIRRIALPCIAGYIATVAAGGSPSLSLAEDLSARWPEVTAWSYTLGGIGEPVFWSSGFDGLGRLVAREMTRPFRMDETPTCDFSLDEGQLLLDSQLRDPLVHLRIKQARMVCIALDPGVNILFPIGEPQPIEHKKRKYEYKRTDSSTIAHTKSEEEFIERLADAIWPHISNRIEQQTAGSKGDRTQLSRSSVTKRGSKRSKRGPQGDLLNDK